MKLLLDEMYTPIVAEQLRSRGHDVVSVHEPDYRHLEGAPDVEIFAAAIAFGRALMTENVADFRLLETEARAAGNAGPILVFTTDRHFPRGHPGTLGRLVVTLDSMLSDGDQASSFFLREKIG